jgi:branched-subunit amino acid transport protein
MNTIGLWLTLFVIGLITFAYRLSFIALMDRLRVPVLLQRALRFVPVAALTAIIIPDLVIHNGAVDVSLANFRLIAGLVAVLVAWRTKNTLLTIGVGMATLWLLQLVLG